MLQRITALLLALGALAAIPTAVAQTSRPTAKQVQLVIRGAGYGHGVGMSQFGAYGMATRGSDYKAILAHYYRGTALAPVGGPRTVRILLRNAPTARFSGATSTAGGQQLDPAKLYTAAPGPADQVVLRDADGKTVAAEAAPLRVRGSSTSSLRLRGKAQNGVRDGRYRGALELRPTPAGTLLAINAVGLESYVRGVVSAESPADWPAAALEAQAVAARTYAITTEKAVTNGFDHFADVRSQVYGGIKAERPTTDAAVTTTRDQVVTYAGKPAVTFFFSTSGGKTENVENGFAGADPEPWLVSVDDPYDVASPYHRWDPITITLAQATKRLKGLVKGTLQGIRVTRRGVSPRVVAANVIGTGGTTRVTGEQLKARLGLRDTWMSFSLVTRSGKTVTTPTGGSPVTTTPTTVPTTTTTTPTTGGAGPGAGTTPTTTGPATTGSPDSSGGAGPSA